MRQKRIEAIHDGRVKDDRERSVLHWAGGCSPNRGMEREKPFRNGRCENGRKDFPAPDLRCTGGRVDAPRASGKSGQKTERIRREPGRLRHGYGGEQL